MRNIAILRDGYSDFLVVRKFIKTLLNKHKNENLEDSSFIDLGQLNITNPLVKYLDSVSKTQNYSFYTQEATDLKRQLITIFFGCYSRFITELDNVTSRELIIINADSEKLLLNRSNYFNAWAYSIKDIVQHSIECFYEEMVKQGYSYNNLPFITPLILFPSSEILVACCKYNTLSENLRQLKPNPALKTKVYGTHSIPDAIENGALELTLNTYLTDSNMEEIYREIPESRVLIHSLII